MRRVLVLPLDPVIATIDAAERRRWRAAMSPSARVVSATATQAVPRVSGRSVGQRPSSRSAATTTPLTCERGEHLRQEGVPVVHLAADRDEGLARRDRAGVDREAGKAGVGRPCTSRPAGRLDDVVEGPLHAACP